MRALANRMMDYVKIWVWDKNLNRYQTRVVHLDDPIVQDRATSTIMDTGIVVKILDLLVKGRQDKAMKEIIDHDWFVGLYKFIHGLVPFVN